MRRRLLAAIACLATAAGAGQGLVRNPGFEQLDASGKQLAAWGLPAKKGVRFATDDAVSHSGKRSGRIDGLDAEVQDRYVQAWRQDVGPLPDAELLLSVWVKAEKLSQGRINVLHKDKTGTVLVNQGIAGFEGTFDWREIAAPLRRVPGAVRLQLVLGLQKSTGTLWVDDVSVTPAGTGGAYGQATMTPSEPQVAGSTVPARFEIVLGEPGLADGGRITLRWEDWRPAREFRFGEATAACSKPGAAFQVATPPKKKSWPPTPRPVARVVTLEKGGPLPEGTTVSITAPLTYTRYSNVACGLQVLLSPTAGSASRPLGRPFDVAARGGPPVALLCIAEARPLVGQPGRVTVAATDRFGNPSADFRGTVALACNTDAGLPAEHAFTETDGGSHAFEGRFPKGVVSRVQVASGEMTATSNPILPRDEGEAGIWFGDIHSHCELSADAVGDPDAAYDYARRFWGLDLAALTDHSPRGAKWKRAVEAANRHNKPGAFATFVAFEWSHQRLGHRNAYYRGDAGPQQPGFRDNMQSWWDFFDKQETRAITVPHHPNTQSAAKRPDGKSVWGPMDWSIINHEYQRVVELNQNRGSFEVPGGPVRELRVVRKDVGSSVQTALVKGHRLGFIGSTDTHSGRPGTGVARCAILSPGLTRAALWDALHARRCYATSGKHILVLFALNGQPMGSEIRLDEPKTKREIAWRVVGTGPLKRVDLLRNNEVVKSWEGGGKDDLSGSFVRAEPITATEWWYLRIIQADTEMAWSSPIWVDPPE